MNMNFERPHGLELQHGALRTVEPSADKSTTKRSWPKYALWSLIALGASYLAVNASGRSLLIVGGVIVALAVLATLVCIRAAERNSLLVRPDRRLELPVNPAAICAPTPFHWFSADNLEVAVRLRAHRLAT